MDIHEAVSLAVEGTDAPSEEGGQGVEGQGETAESTTPYFDPSEYSDHLVKVTINGEEQDVPVADLVNGYSRQSDYTRKTQELAGQREQLAQAEALWNALQSNPHATLNYLAETYGVDSEEYADAYDQAYGEEQGDEYFDPRYEELAAQNAWLLQQEQVRSEQEMQYALHSKLDQLGHHYGADFDPKEVVQRGLETGRTNLEDIESLAKEVMFDKLYARQLGQQQAQQVDADDDAQRRAAAQAAGIVSTGGSAASVSTAPAPLRHSSIEDVVAAAYDQLTS